MAIAVGNATKFLKACYDGGSTNVQFSGTFTVSTHNNDGNRIIVMLVEGYDRSQHVTGITWDGVALTQIATLNFAQDAGDTARIEFWELPNAASGTKNLVFTKSGGTTYLTLVGEVFSISGSHTSNFSTGAATSHGSGATASRSVVSATGDLVIGGLAVWQDAHPEGTTPTTGTQIAEDDINGQMNDGGTTTYNNSWSIVWVAGAASVTPAWNKTNGKGHGAIGFSVPAAVAGTLAKSLNLSQAVQRAATW